LIRSYFVYLFSILIVFSACQSNDHTQSKNNFFFQRIDDAIITDSGYEIPKPLSWTNDYADLFTDVQIKYLDSLSGYYEKNTSVEIATVTIPSYLISENHFEPYSLEILNEWGIGKPDKNNGILIAIAPKYRRVRIQNGYGIEKFLSDKQTKVILDSVMVPCFSKENYFEGVKQGIIAIMSKLRKNGMSN
jgi:uncharacterized protein